MANEKIKITGDTALYAKLRNLAKKYGKNVPTVTVGYKASYALWVHENLDALHQNGEAKFLERPFMEYRKFMQHRVAELLGKGIKLAKALFMVGLFLQRKSQELVPVNTGNLKNSAYTEVK
jgi:hypothetical protein